MTLPEEKELDNLEVWEENNETPEEQDNSHTDKLTRYKQQMEWSKAEAKRQHDMWLEREVERASRDAKSLLELHKVDPKLADEVARKFWYDDFEDAKWSISGADDWWVEKTKTADFEDNFERLYQERRAKEVHEDAIKRADKILSKIKDDTQRDVARRQFEKITAGKTLTVEEAEEFADMATLYVNKDSLRANRYDEWLWNYASTWMWMWRKPESTEWKIEVVRNGKIVYLDSNKQ